MNIYDVAILILSLSLLLTSTMAVIMVVITKDTQEMIRSMKLDRSVQNSLTKIKTQNAISQNRERKIMKKLEEIMG